MRKETTNKSEVVDGYYFTDKAIIKKTRYIDIIFEDIRDSDWLNALSEKKRYCGIILANVLFAGKPISILIPKHKKEFSKHYPKINFRNFFKVYNAMWENGWIDEHKCHVEGEETTFNKIVVIATQKLINKMESLDPYNLGIDFPRKGKQ